MPLQGNPVDGGLDRRIEQFDDQNEQYAEDHQSAADTADRQEKAQGNEHRDEQCFLTESRFAAPGLAQAVGGIAAGIPETLNTGFSFEWAFF